MNVDYFSELETPRFARLAQNLVAAVFPQMKLMPAKFILDQAEKSGELQPGGHIIETTSGTFGMALALLSAARGYNLTLITTTSLTDTQFRTRLRQAGATVIALDDPRGDGDQAGRLGKLHQVIRSKPNVFWTQQYESDGNWLAYAKLADLFVRAVGKVDVLVGCVGTGGSLCGTGAALLNRFPQMKIVAIDTHNSVLFGHPRGRRMLRGLGNNILPANLRHHLIDEVHWVGAHLAFREARKMLLRHGIFQGPTSGAAALVAQWIAQKHRDATVAVILPDEGHRYNDTVYSDTWLAALPNWQSEHSSTPSTLREITPYDENSWTRFSWNRRQREEVMKAQGLPS